MPSSQNNQNSCISTIDPLPGTPGVSKEAPLSTKYAIGGGALRFIKKSDFLTPLRPLGSIVEWMDFESIWPLWSKYYLSNSHLLKRLYLQITSIEPKREGVMSLLTFYLWNLHLEIQIRCNFSKTYIYWNIASINSSWLKACFKFYRQIIKWKFDVYLLSDNLQYNTLGHCVDCLINQVSGGPSIILIDWK